MTRRTVSALVALTLASSLAAQEPPPLHLASLPAEAARSAAEAGPPEGRYRIVQFSRPPGARERERVGELGAILGYLPENAYLVRLHDPALEARAESFGAAWVGDWSPALRVSRAVRELAAASEPRSRWVVLSVDPFADLPRVEAAVAGIVGSGAVVGRARAPRFQRLGLLLAPDQLVRASAAIAGIAEVLWIDLEPRRKLLNDTTAWVGQTGLDGGQATPLYEAGINGAGQVVAVLDTGLDAGMCFFRESNGTLPPVNACNGGTASDPGRRKVIAGDFLWSAECAGGISTTEWDTHGHGTHVSGTALGDNGVTPGGRDATDGMAPGAKLVIQDGGFATDDCGDLPGIGCPVVDLNPIFQQTYSQGARIHSNSYGDNENATVQNDYSAASADVDEFMWSHPDFLVVFAAGNSGPGNNTVGTPSTNKNGLSVGSTQRGGNAGSMSGFSSCGWTDDVRIKPDLTVPGSSIVSANDDGDAGTANCNSTTMSGTSMATPGAAGFAALVRQYYADGFHPTGTATPGDAFAPSAALVKATMLASTRAMENVATPPPSRCQGWGRVTLDDALALGAEARRLLARDEAAGFGAAGENEVVTFVVEDGAESLRAVLAWTDPASIPAASVHLVQDLDLEAYSPLGVLYRGNVWGGGQSVPGGAADRRNNVEQARLAAPATGIWALRVSAFALPTADQPWALAVAGAITPCLFCDGFASGGTTLWSSTAP